MIIELLTVDINLKEDSYIIFLSIGESKLLYLEWNEYGVIAFLKLFGFNLIKNQLCSKSILRYID